MERGYVRSQMFLTLATLYVFQIDMKEEVQTALQSPSQVGCRELATVLACSQVLCSVLRERDSESDKVLIYTEAFLFFQKKTQ